MVETVLGPATRTRLHRLLTWSLAVALVVAVAGVAYVAVITGDSSDAFTEFYVLGAGGDAAEYPTNLTAGETAEVGVGVVNNENQQMTYSIVVVRDGGPLGEQSIEVADGARWEGDVEFTATEAGNTQVEILLYRGRNPDVTETPYRRLTLPVEVAADDSSASL